ncbi:MAG: hypothetical protein QMC24_08820 [Akkermansiaceae bacterium]|jgi:hypothetical protein
MILADPQSAVNKPFMDHRVMGKVINFLVRDPGGLVEQSACLAKQAKPALIVAR